MTMSMKSWKNEEISIEKLKEKADKLAEQNQSLTILSAIDCIIELAEDSRLCEEFMTWVNRYASYLANRQNITKIQAILFSLFVEASATGDRTSLSEIANYLGCSNIKVLKYLHEIDGLVKKGLLIQYNKEGKEGNFYTLPVGLFVPMIDDQPYCQPSFEGCTEVQLFQKFYDLSMMRHDHELSTELMLAETKRLFNANENLGFVKKLRMCKLDGMDEIILTQICRYLVLNKRDSVCLEWLAYLYDKQHQQYDLAQALRSGQHTLIKKGLVEPAFNNGLGDDNEYMLTENAHRKLLKGCQIIVTGTDGCDIISCTSISPKELFFDNQVKSQIERLGHLLSEKEYKDVCQRLHRKGLRQGFACLFYGAPGTGKTESVLQLARQSGRSILQVNISEVKSKWVGESEKNIKAIFERYQVMTRQAKTVPILLFNEADAILGIRKKNADDSVSKMENAIQNIILQEMEQMDGILIATTNLEENLDKAFERRFLYKVKFENPSLPQREAIWQSMMPSLPKSIVAQLARSYDFSGGQIENIARKCDIDSVLYGEGTITDTVINQYCLEETITRKRNNKIGFTL